MTNEIRWRRAVKADRCALADFTCTEDRRRLPNGRRLPAPSPWEREVESEIRKSKKIGAVGRILLVGEGANGSVVAVGAALPDGLAYLVEFVAVSKGQQGRGIGRALINELAREILKAVGGRPVYVYGKVHPSNDASIAWMRALNFTREPEFDVRDDHGHPLLLFFSKTYQT